MNNIEIINPYLGFVALPLVAIVVIFFFVLPKRKRKLLKNKLSLGLHLVMCVTLSLAFMDIRFLNTSKSSELYIVADCSASETLSSEKLDELVKGTYDKVGPSTKIGVVAFAKEAKVITPIGAGFDSVKSVYEDESFDKSATDIENALRYVNSLYSEDTVRRMILISDGVETDGSAINAIEDLLNNDVSIDCVYLAEQEEDEIAVTGLSYVDKAFLGREQTLKASIRSRKEAQVALKLFKDKQLLETKITQVNRGLNVLDFTLPSDVTGAFDYELTVNALDGSELKDTYLENNTMAFRQEISDDFKVLLIEGAKEDRSALANLGLFGEKTEVTEYIYNSTKIPYTLENLLQYDEVILSDVDLSKMANNVELVTNLRTLVSAYGKSLLTFGQNHTGPSTETFELYKEMLPVQYESQDQKAVILNIDVSGSMETDNRLTKAKQGAIACVDILEENDYVGIVAFSDEGEVIQPLTTKKNRPTIVSNINAMQTIGGTQMGAGLTKCDALLKNSTIEYKHVITLSDGDPFETPTELSKQVAEMAKKNIVLSFINISNPSGESLLKMLSDDGNGRYYYASTSASLIKVMLSSVSNAVADTSVVGKAEIQYRTPADPVMKGITTLPDLMGYNYCRIRQEATTVLTTQYISEESSGGGVAAVPVYAYWAYGNGKVSYFTSSLGSWTSTFRASESGKLFFQNLGVQMAPERASDQQIQMTYKNQGFHSLVSVTANDTDQKAEVKFTLTSPKGETKEYALNYDGKAYSALLPIAEIGMYTAHIAYSHHVVYNNGEVHLQLLGEVDEPLYFDYSSEYNVFDKNDGSLLYRLAKSNGTVSIGEVNYETLANEIEYRSYKSSMMWFLFGSLGLFLVDVFIRKSEFKKKKKDEELAMGANK